MPKGRPGGNPELKKYQFEQKYSWDEPCSAKLTLRLPPSLYEELKKIPDWQEFARQAIAAEIERAQSPQSD